MSLDIGQALRSGIDDIASETGVLVGAVFLLYNLASLVVGESFSAATLELLFERGVYSTAEREAIESLGGSTPLALDLALPIVAVLLVVVTLVGELVRYWGIRSFAGPAETATDAIGDRVAMMLVLGGGVALLQVFFSSVLPIAGQLGGLATTLIGSFLGPVVSFVILAVFVYLRQEIALNDGGYATTVKRSFARFMDDPASILAVLLILGIVGVIGSLPGTIIGFVGGGTTITLAGRLLSTVLRTVTGLLGIAVVTDAYIQVRAAARESEV
jgi:hypothetical protein